jgi:hypothetical protein
MLKIKGDSRTRKPGVMHWALRHSGSVGHKLIEVFYILPDGRRLGSTFELHPHVLNTLEHRSAYLESVFRTMSRQLEASLAGVGTVHRRP